MRRKSMGRLIIDGNRVYELDEACLQKKKKMGQIKESDRKIQREWESNMQRRGKQ